MSNKRRRPSDDTIEFASSDDSDFSCESDDEEISSDTSSGEEEEEEVAVPVVINSKDPVHWRSVSSSFVPRKTIPIYKKPITSIRESDSITDVFLKLFPKSMFMWIAQCTNERLSILSEEKGKIVAPTNWHEISIVIGCLLVMSYNRVPHMYMYWSSNKSVRNETIANAISRDRFMLLHSKLYLNSPAKLDGAKKTYYMTEVIKCLKKNSDLRPSFKVSTKPW